MAHAWHWSLAVLDQRSESSSFESALSIRPEAVPRAAPTATPTAIHTGLEVAAYRAAPTPVPRATPTPAFNPEGFLSVIDAIVLLAVVEILLPIPLGASMRRVEAFADLPY
jgi:hypothetical protein